MHVEIWSDVVCPWCYIGKRHFEAALAGFAHRDEVEVTWRSFELDPAAPKEREGPYVRRLSRKYRVSEEEAQVMIDRITTAGAAAGLTMRFDISRPGNSFDAHRVIHLGRERGIQDAMKERLMRATFEEGEPIGDRATLVRLAADAGLDPDETAAVLESDRFGDDVRADERLAGGLDIHAVPCFVVDRKYTVGGAQRPEILRRVLNHAHTEMNRTS